MPKLIGDRLQTLSAKAAKPIYARIYADASILAANYARIAAGQQELRVAASATYQMGS